MQKQVTLCLLLLTAGLVQGMRQIFTGIGKEIQKNVVAVATPIEETLVFIGSSQCSGVKRIIGVAYNQLDESKDEPDVDKLTIEYRDQYVRVVFNITTAADRILLAQEFDLSKKLYIFIHGFTDDPTKSSFKTISDALLSQGESNVLALDGSPLIKGLYLRSTTYVRFMGEKMGQVLAAMVEGGVDPQKIHVIGHSLGAHISGFTGKTFQNLTGMNLGRITGLDPAGPCFSHIDDELRLHPTDADYVDAIHTDAGVYGLKENVAQTDYYPNGGSQQPNCLFQTCSHSRAWLLFSESVTNPQAFPAVSCESYSAFRKGNCTGDVSYMGHPSEPGTTGQYYLQTNDDSPYGKGMDGIKFKKNEGILRNIFG